MRILACFPNRARRTLSGIYYALRDVGHEVVFYGEGHDGCAGIRHPGIIMGDPDLVLMADPKRQGSTHWDLAGIADSARRVAFACDTWNGLSARTVAWLGEQGIHLLLARQRDDVMSLAAAAPRSCRVQWLPFAVDEEVFKPYDERKLWDVAIFGHRGHIYPLRSRAERMLKALGGRFKSFLVHGLREPTIINEQFARAICRARIVVECSNKWGYLVPKHFEIAACGVPMICNDGTGHGFREMFLPDAARTFHNAVELPNMVLAMLKDWETTKAMARRATEIVHAGHTEIHRARQLIDLVEAL